MHLRSRLALAAAFLLATFALAAAPARAAATLDSVDYFCPVTLSLVVTRELPATTTSTGTANQTLATRHGNRELLEAVVATHGGHLSDWRLVAYANSATFDELADLALVARHRDGRLIPVDALVFSELTYLPAASDAYDVTRSAVLDETLSATFDQKRVATLAAQTIAGGSFEGGGTVASVFRFGTLRFRGHTLRALTPARTVLKLVGTHDSPAGTGVARLTVSVGPPRLVPIYSQ